MKQLEGRFVQLLGVFLFLFFFFLLGGGFIVVLNGKEGLALQVLHLLPVLSIHNTTVSIGEWELQRYRILREQSQVLEDIFLKSLINVVDLVRAQ